MEKECKCSENLRDVTIHELHSCRSLKIPVLYRKLTLTYPTLTLSDVVTVEPLLVEWEGGEVGV